MTKIQKKLSIISNGRIIVFNDFFSFFIFIYEFICLIEKGKFKIKFCVIVTLNLIFAITQMNRNLCRIFFAQFLLFVSFHSMWQIFFNLDSTFKNKFLKTNFLSKKIALCDEDTISTSWCHVFQFARWLVVKLT